LKSNRWPGAQVVAYNDKFANIYIGDGLKEVGNPQQDFIAPPLGAIQKEYVVDEATPDILTEQIDPTVEQEEQLEEEKKGEEKEAAEEEEEE
jgi:radial spoke head protein 4A